MKKKILPVILTIALILTSCLKVKGAEAEPMTNVSESLALDLAFSYSKDTRLGGWLVPPEKAYGQVMTYDEAMLFVFGKSVEPNTKEYEKRNKTIWLIVLEGEFVEHVPASAGGDIPATEIIHKQMIIFLDGETGEIMREILPSPQMELPVTNLPVLQKTNEEFPVLPTRAPALTEVPYPTLPAIQ
ncbi:MAG TPA: hypothetical protein PKJ84_08245 [Anaerolineales bacterium]|nr:hypothetical protein [Anaerolineales bacterium]HNC90284.1 hypothetical protein [Anaerolineales bacterium]HNE04839.1 hypothetical protein [Anaerolineales bacterium]HNO94147.1 hypothetical protein [Anaerolineales bacterium]